MQNGYVESFNGRMRDELLNETLFHGLDHARSLIREWARDYNTCRPHSSIGYQTPAGYAESSPLVVILPPRFNVAPWPLAPVPPSLPIATLACIALPAVSVYALSSVASISSAKTWPPLPPPIDLDHHTRRQVALRDHAARRGSVHRTADAAIASRAA